MRFLMIAAALAIAGCTTAPIGVKPGFSGGSQRDGMVTMASTGTLYNPIAADWRLAATEAGRRCRAWGYAGADEYAGWQEACSAYDRHGRCARSVVTRFYPCTG